MRNFAGNFLTRPTWPGLIPYTPYTESYPHSQTGFTLPELMITGAIIAILLKLSLPALINNEEKEAERVFLQLNSVLGAARAAALSRFNAVSICPLAAQTHSASPDRAVCSSNWNQGVLVFLDRDGDGQLDLEDTIIDYQPWGGSSNGSTILSGTLHWRVFGNRHSIRISRTGEISDQNGSLSWCPPPGSVTPPHQLILNSGGRARLAVDENGDGQREDSQGRPLSC